MQNFGVNFFENERTWKRDVHVVTLAILIAMRVV